MRAVVALCLAAVGTYAIRLGSVRAFGSRPVPPVAARVLRHAAIGIMSSLAISSLPGSGSTAALTAAAVAGAAAVVVAAQRLGNMAAVMAIGVAVYGIIERI